MLRKPPVPVKRARPDAGSLLASLNLPASTGDAVYALAYSNYLAGRIRQAERLFHALLLLDPAKPQAYLGLGVILARRADLRQAITLFHMAVECQEDWSLPWFHLAAAYLEEGRMEPARAAIARFFQHLTSETPKEIIREAKRMRKFVGQGSADADAAIGESIADRPASGN